MFSNGPISSWTISGFQQYLNSAVSESVTGSDSVASVLFAAALISETSTASDSVDAPGSIFNSSVILTGNASSQFFTQPILVAQVEEEARGGGPFGATANFVSLVNEVAIPSDAVSAASIFVSSVAETGVATDIVTPSFSVFTTIPESATGADTVAITLNMSASVAETSSSSAQVSSLGIFNPQFSDSVVVRDVALAGVTFQSLFSDSASILDTVSGAYLWNPVDDSQGSIWQPVNDSQTGGWTPVNDSQGSVWVEINPNDDKRYS